MDANKQRDEVQSRLSPATERSILPLHKSGRTEVCSVYWLPVSDTPTFGRELYWLRRFMDQLHAVLTRDGKLRQESFLQMKLTAPQGQLKEMLHRNQIKLIPIVGLGRRPQAALPPIPSIEDMDPIIKGKARFDFNEHVADYMFWFLNRDEAWKRELFMGSGGYTMLYMPPDPTSLPQPFPDYPAVREMPAFKAFDMEMLWQAACLLGDPFREKSKAVFGKGLEDDASFEGLTFVIPYLKVSDLNNATPDELKEWFTVFDVMITESPEDHGWLIISREDLDATLHQILQEMRAAGDPHPIYPMTAEESR